MELYDELLTIITLFEDNQIDYALCGGIAVAFHGYARFTKDIDFLVQESDLERITILIADIGYEMSSGRMPFGSGTPHFREVFRISKFGENELFTLDFMLVTPVFEDVWEDREVFEWQERQIQVVSISGLSKMKKLAGRDQDLLDLKKLGVIEDE